MLKQTPSQTVGPFFHFALRLAGENQLVNEQTRGERIYVTGTVLDGDGQPVPDAMIEIWQADAQGIFNHPADPRCGKADRHFRGFGRADTVQNGQFSFKTIKPGCVPWDEEHNQAPHINVHVFARGMLTHVVTRLYLSDEDANRTDPILNMIDDPVRRQTLIATRMETGDLPTYCFNIILQGDGETVFFNP
jgi:protocatechuate 3,4-dioxygenase alpha subunit